MLQSSISEYLWFSKSPFQMFQIHATLRCQNAHARSGFNIFPNTTLNQAIFAGVSKCMPCCIMLYTLVWRERHCATLQILRRFWKSDRSTALHCTSLEASCLCWGYDILGHLIEVKSGAECQNSRSPKSFEFKVQKRSKDQLTKFQTFREQLVELWPWSL